MNTRTKWNIAHLARMIFCLLTVALTGAVVYGQGFMVTPMRVEVYPRMGETINQAVVVRNTTTRPETVLLSLSLLNQNEQGSSDPVEPSSERAAALRRRSCYDWLTLSEASVDIPPMENRSVYLRGKVPFRVNGCYAAVLSVRNKPAAAVPGKFNLDIKFLVPILLQVQGPAARDRIALTDLGMAFTPGSTNNAATTTTTLQIANTGDTFSRIQGQVTILCPAGERWRQITQVTTPERAILPGVTLKLPLDLKRRLPSGRYKLQGSMLVDGQIKCRIEREVDFTGDPTIKTIATDAALMLQPPDIKIKAVPGSQTSTVISLINPTKEAIRINCVVTNPKVLLGTSLGELQGKHFACADWTTISPSSFSLPAGGRQSLRVMTRVSGDTGKALPNFFADLEIHASYIDGQSAGNIIAPITILNSQATGKKGAQPGEVTLAQQEDGRSYLLTAMFCNTGTLQFTPKVTAYVLNAAGGEVLTSPLSSASARFLPLETKQYSGVLDFSKCAAGTHVIKATLVTDNLQVNGTATIKIEDVDGKRVVTTIPHDNKVP